MTAIYWKTQRQKSKYCDNEIVIFSKYIIRNKNEIEIYKNMTKKINGVKV